MALQASRPALAPADLADRYVALEPRALRGVLASLALVMLAASLDFDRRRHRPAADRHRPAWQRPVRLGLYHLPARP